MGRFLRKPSPAMVVACLALTIALSGTGYAVSQLPRNSVGTAQLKTDAVVGSKVKRDSLSGLDVSEASLRGVPLQGLAGSSCSVGSKRGALLVTSTDVPDEGVAQAAIECVAEDGWEQDDTQANPHVEHNFESTPAKGIRRTIFPARDEDWLHLTFDDPAMTLGDASIVDRTGSARLKVYLDGNAQASSSEYGWTNDPSTPLDGDWMIQVYGNGVDSYALRVLVGSFE